MSDQNDPETEQGKDVFVNLMGTLALAFGISWLVKKLLIAFGVAPQMTMVADLLVFCTIIYVDPVAAWRKGKSLRDLGVKLSVGVVLALIVAIPMMYAFDFGHPPAPEAAATEKDTKGISFSFPWMILAPMLIFPLFFMGPIAVKAMKAGTADEKVTVEDVKISAAFPAYIMFSTVLNLAVPGAMWLIGVPVMLAAVIMVAAILLCITETWLADPEDLAEDVDNTEWGPRAESAEEAWGGFRKAVRQCFASALFLGSVIYISLQLAMPFLGDISLHDQSPVQFLTGFIAMAGVMLASTLILFAVGIVLLACAAYALGRMQGSDPLTIVELVKQAQMRLLGGGMQWVRPDIEDI